MDASNFNRRGFLATTATVAVAGTGLGPAVAYGAYDPAEVSEWKRLIGSRFETERDTVRLQSVVVTDYSSDRARPRHVRPYAISLRFVSDNARQTPRSIQSHDLHQGAHRIVLAPVIPPEGETGVYYEGIIN